MNKHPTSATLSVDESAALLGVSRWAIYDSVSRGEIQAIRVGRRIRIARQPLLDLLGLTSTVPPELDVGTVNGQHTPTETGRYEAREAAHEQDEKCKGAEVRASTPLTSPVGPHPAGVKSHNKKERLT